MFSGAAYAQAVALRIGQAKFPLAVARPRDRCLLVVAPAMNAAMYENAATQARKITRCIVPQWVPTQVAQVTGRGER